VDQSAESGTRLIYGANHNQRWERLRAHRDMVSGREHTPNCSLRFRP